MRDPVARRRIRTRGSIAGMVFAAPAALLILTITLAPLLVVVAISFTNWQLGSNRAVFTGLSNYMALATDRTFLATLSNTVLYVLMTVPLSLVLGLAVALGLSRTRRAQGFYQALYFIPNIAVLPAIAIVWGVILHPGLGPVSWLASAMGIDAPNWLKDEMLALPALALIGLWQGIGFCMLFMIAGLSGIDRTFYDAAMIDGVRSPWDRFWLVTWPQLAPTTLFLLVVSAAHAFQAFETVAVLTQGGPQGATQVLLYSIYQEGFVFLRANHAAALSVVLLVLLIGLTILQVKLLDRRISYR